MLILCLGAWLNWGPLVGACLQELGVRVAPAFAWWDVLTLMLRRELP